MKYANPLKTFHGEVLGFLPDRVTKQKRYNNTMLFRMESEVAPTVQLRLKVEINCYEHFSVLGLTKIPFRVENSERKELIMHYAL